MAHGDLDPATIITFCDEDDVEYIWKCYVWNVFDDANNGGYIYL